MVLRLIAIGAVLFLAIGATILLIGGPAPRERPQTIAGDAPVAGGEAVAATTERTTAPDAQPGAATPLPAPRATAPPRTIGGPFRLTRLDGEAALVGHPSLMLFGYSGCQTACPPLAEIGSWLDALGNDAANLAVYFVTIDPARDTAPVLAAFLAGYDPRIVGLTGAPGEVDDMLALFGVDHGRLAGAAAGGGYELEQPAWAYLHRNDGTFVGRLGFDEPREAILVKLRGLAIAGYEPAQLDALCGTLSATRREATLATHPVSLWRTCAERGFAEAQYGLALMLDEGVLLARDAIEALIWAVRGGRGVSALTARLQAEMRPLEYEDAVRRAQDWTPVR